MALKSGTSITEYNGGTLKIEASVPSSLVHTAVTDNQVEWDLEAMNWAENASVSADGTTFTGEYTMSDADVTIPGSQSLEVVLKVYGAANGTQIAPTFKVSLVGNSEGEEATVVATATTVSAKPEYNVRLMNNQSLKNQIDLTENGTTITGRVYGYSVALELYNEDENKGLKGLEYPNGDITFDIDLKMEKVANNATTDITDQAMPILYNYDLNLKSNSEGKIANRPMKFNSNTSYLPIEVLSREGGYRGCYDSGTIQITQTSNKLNVTMKNYAFNGEFPITRYNEMDAYYDIPSNEGCFASGYIQILVPYTEATESESNTYKLIVTDDNLSVPSGSGTITTTQGISTDDMVSLNFLRTIQNTYSYNVWINKATGDRAPLYSYYTKQDPYAGIGRKITAETRLASYASNEGAIYSTNSLLKFDGEAFEIIEIDGKQWVKEAKVTGYQVCNMDLQMLYAAKLDGTNWVDETEMKNAKEEDLLFFTSLESLESYFESQSITDAKCIGVLWESISGTMEPSEGYQLGVNLQVTNNAQIGKVYPFVTIHKLYDVELDREVQTRSNPNATFPTAYRTINNGKKFTKASYDEDGNLIQVSNYIQGQSLLIVNGLAKVENTVADIVDGQPKVNYDLGRGESEVRYNIKPKLEFAPENTNVITDITMTLTDTLPAGLKYISGSSSSEYGEPTVTENQDGTSTLVWTKGGCTLGEELPILNFKAAIDFSVTNGTTLTNTVIIKGDKITPYLPETRTATTTINVVKLASYSLTQSTTTPIIEQNNNGTYTISMLNLTNQTLSDFQLLDILPYNDDSNGSSYSGTYTVSDITYEVTSANGNVLSTVPNLRFSTTTNTSVRNGVTAKTSGLGNGGIWESKATGEGSKTISINEALTAIAMVAELPANSRITITIGIQTSGNVAGDIYSNKATVQTTTSASEIASPKIDIEVNGYAGATQGETKTQYYNSNGAVSTVVFTLATNGFTRTNYVFRKWAEDDAFGAKHNEGETVSYKPAVDAIITTKEMYALWTRAGTGAQQLMQGTNSMQLVPNGKLLISASSTN